MDRPARLTGRPHGLFRYAGHPEAERVAIAIGSAVEVPTRSPPGRGHAGEKVAY
jgi:pyruvate-ferredoxin/flavodoxin oxidoreductase